MTHIPNRFDVITDLRRCIYASYSDLQFKDENVKFFLENAEKNLEAVKDEVEKNIFKLIKKRLAKARNDKNFVERRREDLLSASCLLN